MADQEKDKQMQIDEMLDSLLANYSVGGAASGAGNRILANLQGGSREANRLRDGGISNGFGREWLRRQSLLRRC